MLEEELGQLPEEEMNYPEFPDSSMQPEEMMEEDSEPEMDDPIMEAIKRDLIMVHMSTREADDLDYMQGGPMIHPETEFRMYPRLALMMKDESFRNFLEQLAEEIVNSGHADKATEDTYKKLPKEHEVSPGFTMAPGDFSTEGIKLGADGERVYKDDDIVVHLPTDFADMMDEVRGGMVRNPEDDLRQYGNTITQMPRKIVREVITRPLEHIGIKHQHSNEFIRIASTVGGYVVTGGSPWGAAAGNYYGNWVTGADPKKSAIRGAKVGAATYAAQTLAGSMGNMFGGTQAAEGVPTFVNGVQQVGSNAGAGAGAGAGANAGAGLNAANQAKNVAESAGLGIGDMFRYGMPIASAGLMYMGAKKEKKEEERLKREHQEELTRFRKDHGMDESLHPLIYQPTEYNPQQGDFSYGRERLHYQPKRNYAKGGNVDHGMDLLPGEEVLQTSKLIQGEGKGQDDKIPVNVPEGTFIWDSHSVSQLGDGSTRAGAALLDALSERAKKHAHSLGGKVKLSPNRVPTMLSDGEYAMDPLAVAGLGHGSNEVGSNNIDIARKNLRKKKISNGSGLPPMAGNILDLFPRPVKSKLSRVA